MKILFTQGGNCNTRMYYYNSIGILKDIGGSKIKRDEGINFGIRFGQRETYTFYF